MKWRNIIVLLVSAYNVSAMALQVLIKFYDLFTQCINTNLIVSVWMLDTLIMPCNQSKSNDSVSRALKI